MSRVKLSDTRIQNARAAPEGQRIEIYDSDVKGFALRVTSSGHKSFVLRGRLDGKVQRFTIGDVSAITLDRARELARDWNALLRQGKSPKDERERLRRDEQRKRADKLGTVMEEFFKRKLKGTRTGKKVEADLRRELTGWWQKPIVDISRRDVRELIEKKAEKAPCQAHHLFSYLGRFFNWAVRRDLYGLDKSPMDGLDAADLCGAKVVRTRVLVDDEIVVFWKATRRMAYPFGPLFRLLLLCGARKSEVSDAQRPEIDQPAALFTVPPERFKSNRTHLIPLSTGALEIMKSLPRFNRDFVFTTTFGEKPVDGFSKAKQRCDRLMLRYLKALARLRGDDPSEVTLKPWVLHDLRRTCRTRLSALKVQDTVAELVIGHSKKGLRGVYDQHEYLDEMRAALEAWSVALQKIVSMERTPSNVVPLRAPA